MSQDMRVQGVTRGSVCMVTPWPVHLEIVSCSLPFIILIFINSVSFFCSSIRIYTSYLSLAINPWAWRILSRTSPCHDPVIIHIICTSGIFAAHCYPFLSNTAMYVCLYLLVSTSWWMHAHIVSQTSSANKSVCCHVPLVIYIKMQEFTYFHKFFQHINLSKLLLVTA